MPAHARALSLVGLVLITLVLTTLVLTAAPAAAVGAQGVDLQPLLERRGGVLTADVVEDGTPIDLRLANHGEEPRTVTVTARLVHTSDAGDPALGGPADWIAIDDATAITLAPGDQRQVQARVGLAGYRDATADSVAFVLAIQGDGNVVAQAATIVQLTDGGAQLPVPASLLLLAAGLVALVATAWIRTVRHHGLRPVAVATA